MDLSDKNMNRSMQFANERAQSSVFNLPMNAPTVSVDSKIGHQKGRKSMIELHTMQSTYLDMQNLSTTLRSNSKSRLDPLSSIYIPFVNERDHLGNLVTKPKNSELHNNSVSYKNIGMSIQ